MNASTPQSPLTPLFQRREPTALRRLAVLQRRVRSKRAAVQNERGIALIIVLAVISLLLITVGEFTYSVQLDQHRVRNAIHALQANLLARSGINLAEGFLTLDEKPEFDAYTEQWWLDLKQFCSGLAIGATMRIKCDVEDESGKINVNLTRGVRRVTESQTVTKDMIVRDAMRRLFEAYTIDVQIPDRLADYWQQEPQMGPDGRPLRIPDFASLEDFAATFGIGGRDLQRLRKVMTAQPTSVLGAINANTAPAEVLTAVLNDAEAVSAIRDRQAAEEPFTNATQIRQAIGEVENAAILAQLFNVHSSLFRVQASAMTNVDPEGERGGGIGQTVSELVVRRRDPRRRRPDRPGPGWTLRPLDWQKEGGARLFRAAPDGVESGLDAGDDALFE